MNSTAGQELEVKLELTPQELERIGSHPALEPLTVGKPATETLRSIYYDTRDHRLRAHQLVLRLRARDGGQWTQTVKAGNGVANGFADREEVETLLATPEPDVGAIPDRKLKAKVERALRDGVLEPIFETVVKRTTHKLHCEAGDLELALDQGVVRAGALERPVCEAELELKAGSATSLVETAAQLFASGPFRPAQTSKAERGYNLVLGRQDDSVQPLRAHYPALAGQETSAAALGLFVESALTQIEANRRVVLETDDVEGAHQLRVGLRRLRSALRAFRPLNDTPALQRLEEEARGLARTAGRLRDADVLIEEIYAPVAARAKGEAGFAELRDGALAFRNKLRGEVRDALVGEPWSRLQLHVALWRCTIRESELEGVKVQDFAPTALQRNWKKPAKLGASIETLAFEQRHELRKSLKRLRYVVEFFSSLYAGEDVARFVKELKRMQEILGYMNDVVSAKRLVAIAREYCAASADAQRAAGYVLGWHDAEATHRWKDAGKEFQRLSKYAEYWG
jgi:inorganic triphosphatase YgiF